ncbi:Hypothetical Protein FCC1311_031102 [Hondaea fermentalgiana]|uniref:ABC1 atypical kinase-like domain-containing protein n=1 Tax=Hondaea fermentalgiana TaxID=2315210 RepID=A0A2R5GAY8_9STRA|nr:Hypothetical Protein FCC1311_031102 [Hondaea fermentalgiana]|eukprot:GBG26888.1 Hypothetical Protein FCC1311_031102 [Hondaea fermentalgiana]
MPPRRGSGLARRTLASAGGGKSKAQRSAADLERLAAKIAENPTDTRNIVAELQHTQKNAREAFQSWRKEHTVFLISSGVILGATIFGTGLYIFLEKYPSAIEAFVVEKAVRAFDGSLSFRAKMRVYQGLPEPNLPDFETVFMRAIEEALQQGEKSDAKVSISAGDLLHGWADQVEAAISKAESTVFLAAKTLMRSRLVEEAQELDTLEERVEALREIFPASVERNQAISAQVDAHLAKSDKYVPAHLMERLRPQHPETSANVLTSILIGAIAFFPGPVNKLIHFLDQPAIESEHERAIVIKEIVDDLNITAQQQDLGASAASGKDATPVQTPSLRRRPTGRRLLEDAGILQTALEKTLSKMKQLFDDLTPAMKTFVLTQALNTTISNLQNMPRVGGVSPYDLYVRAIENDLIGPLRRDARITEDMLKEVKHIFLAMPGDLQTRVLLTALRHPLARIPLDEASPEAQAELVRDLLSSGGVVAIKLAQMLAEHPRMPEDFQKMLGDLRDKNGPMPTTEYWWQIPSSVRSTISHIGPCLGTGSVKQANAAIFEDGSKYAVVVLRAQVEDEALSSIGALQTSDELGSVATRLGRLVYGEFNLFNEGEVLNEFASTLIGQHPLFHVVRVRHHSPKCLIEEIASGTSVANVLERPQRGQSAQQQRRRVFDMLVEYHRTVMAAFIKDGVIHSDIHLGNANFYKDIETGKEEFILFDVGQFDRIGLPDTKALLWTLASLATDEYRVLLRSVALAHLASTSSLRDKSFSEKDEKKELHRRLDEAYGEAIALNADGESPDKRTAYMLLLRAAENRGINVPAGAFSVAKMIDGIVSQQERYDLPLVVDDEIEHFLRKHMTWGELVGIGARQFHIL